MRRQHYIIAYSAVLGALFMVWLVTALRRRRTEPVFVPSIASPAGTDADYKGTELAEAHTGQTPRERAHPGWLPDNPPPREA